MDTMWKRLAQYTGLKVIPIETVCHDFFPHLTPQRLLAEIDQGFVALLVTRYADGQETAQGVRFIDLARWIYVSAGIRMAPLSTETYVERPRLNQAKPYTARRIIGTKRSHDRAIAPPSERTPSKAVPR